MVCMLNPQTLSIAFGLAKMQEENVAALRKVIRVGALPPRLAIGPPPYTEKSIMVPI